MITNAKELPHAEIIREIASGVPMNEYEYRGFDWEADVWNACEIDNERLTQMMFSPELSAKYMFRRRKMLMNVNGFAVERVRGRTEHDRPTEAKRRLLRRRPVFNRSLRSNAVDRSQE